MIAIRLVMLSLTLIKHNLTAILEMMARIDAGINGVVYYEVLF